MYRPTDTETLRKIANGLSIRAARAEHAECFELAARLEASARSFRADADRLDRVTAREFA